MGLQHFTISIYKIITFSIRPPEFLSIFNQVGTYYRWFISSRKPTKRSELEEKIKSDTEEKAFVDGLQHQAHIRVEALP